MTNEEFELSVVRTSANHLKHPNALINASLGLCGEAGEVAEIIKKYAYHDKPLEHGDLIKELGDVLFYVTWLCNELDISLSTVMQANSDKLKARYPNGFVPGGGNR